MNNLAQTLTNKTLTTAVVGTPGSYVSTGQLKIRDATSSMFELFGSDLYPNMQVATYTHDNAHILFDASYYATAFRSSHATSQFGIRKLGNVFKFMASGAVAVPNPITWTDALQISTTGLCTFNPGIALPSTGGTASTLNHYEEWTTATAQIWIDSGLVLSNVSVWFTRIGRVVTMKVARFNIGTSGTDLIEIYDTSGAGFPARFLPSADLTQAVTIPRMSTSKPDAGSINFKSSGSYFELRQNDGNQSGNSGGGWVDSFCITYSV